MISLHRNTLIYALWIVRWNKKKKICIDNTIQNEVSDCLRIKTMLSKNFLLRSDWVNVLLIMTDRCWDYVVVDFLINVTLCNNKRSSGISRQTKSIIAGFFCGSHSGNPIRFPLSIHPGWFIFSQAPKSDVSFWDGAPLPLILSLSWKQTFPCRRMRRRKMEEENDEGSPDFQDMSCLLSCWWLQHREQWEGVLCLLFFFFLF